MINTIRLPRYGCWGTTRYVLILLPHFFPTFLDLIDLQISSQNRNPLTGPQIFQDVSAEHAHKTVTIEPFPHSTSLRVASVHPCKHADVMKKVIERMNSTVIKTSASGSGVGGAPVSPSGGKRRWLSRKFTGGSGKDGKKDGKEGKEGILKEGEEEEEEGMRVDFYLVVFLKFIASIVPTIEVDSTTAL